MTINSSGQVSIGGNITGQSINLELSKAANATTSLGDANVRSLAGVGSGAIRLPTDFWGKSTVLAINYLLIAGGGGSGGGGGGAGGLLQGSFVLAAQTTFPVIVGAGSGGVQQYLQNAPNGANSTFNGLTAIGGGGGGGGNNCSCSYPPGSSGGSGGGGDYDDAVHPGGSGTPGQGNNGGHGRCYRGVGCWTGGGGGAGGAAPNAENNSTNRVAGDGLTLSITGTAVNYATGGGSGNAGTYGCGDGYNGVLIVSYVSATQRATGGTVTSFGSGASTTWVHTFSSSGNFVT